MSRKKAPCVDLRTDVLKDERFEVLGEIAGYNRYEAIGRMSALWAWCIDRGLKDAPDGSDGYVVAEPIALRFLGTRGIAALLADGCDELALGVRQSDGRLYLRGTSEYVAARRARQETASAGGRARSESQRDDHGRFVGEPTHIQPTAGAAPAVSSIYGTNLQPTPASSSSSSPSGSDLSPPARAIPPSTEPSTNPLAGRLQLRRRLFTEIWGHAAGKHREARIAGIDPHARDCWGSMPDARSAEALFARIDELTEGDAPDWNRAAEVIRNRVDVAFAEAQHKHKHLAFCTPMRLWDPKSFSIAKDLSPEQVAQPPRAPPGRQQASVHEKPRAIKTFT